MIYQLPINIDKNKIFLVNKSDIEERWDAMYYREHFDFSGWQHLSSIVKIKGGKRIPVDKDYANKTTPYLYLRVSDINEDGYINYSNLRFIDEDVYSILKRYDVTNGDVIMSIAGTIGRTAYISNIPSDKKVILTENCAKLVLTSNSITAEFLNLLLNTSVLQKQISLNYIQTTIPKLGLDRIGRLFIPPIPSIDRQNEIIKKYNKAKCLAKEKEIEAQRLLDSIDSYLLSELGITLPKNCELKPEEIDPRLNAENPLVKNGRLFLTSLSAAITRLDAEYYRYTYKLLTNSINNGTYPSVPMANLLTYIESGRTPSRDEYSDIPTNYPIIKAGSYTDNCIDLDKVGYTNKEQHIKVLKNDIFLLSAAHQAEYLGKQIKYLSSYPRANLSYVGELICLRCDETFQPLLLYALLSTKLYQQLINREKRGQTAHLYSTDIKTLPIPNIPKEIQKRLSMDIFNIYHQISVLKKETKVIIANTQKETELMIMGK